jgi:hypothetical protein
MVWIFVTYIAGNFRDEQSVVTQQAESVFHLLLRDVFKNTFPENFSEQCHHLIGVGPEILCKICNGMILEKSFVEIGL